MSFAFLIPEFPGQTHIFFWREIQALRELGHEVDLVSTRLPSADVISHSWSAEAMGRTTYLFPLSLGKLVAAAGELLRAGPAGWWRCLRAVAGAEAPAGYKLKMLGMILAGAELAAVARRQGWRHVHVHSCANAAVVAMFARLLAGVRYSLTLHGPLRDYGPAQESKWRHAEFAIVITRRLRVEVSNRLQKSLPDAIHIAPMGVDLDRFRRGRAYRPWQSPDVIRIFSCGRLHPCKGHDDLIRAVAMLQARGYRLCLTITGEDVSVGRAYRTELEALARTLGVDSLVCLPGAVTEERVWEELEQAHVFALASLEEPLGVAIMEAMAMEVPVVVTDAGGVPELVESGVSGLLISPRSPELIVAAIERLLGDAELASRMGKAARNRIVNEFSSRRSAQVIADSVSRSTVSTRQEMAGV